MTSITPITKTFADAVRMSEDPNQGVLRTFGENGCPSLIIMGILAYFQKLLRGLSEERHYEFITNIFQKAHRLNLNFKYMSVILKFHLVMVH